MGKHLKLVESSNIKKPGAVGHTTDFWAELSRIKEPFSKVGDPEGLHFILGVRKKKRARAAVPVAGGRTKGKVWNQKRRKKEGKTMGYANRKGMPITNRN